MNNELIDAPSMFRLARNVSRHSTHKKQKLGAVVVINGHPIGVGFNKGKTHPNAPHTGLHAEIVAIKNSGRNDLRGASIFVYRKRKDGTIGISKPCKHCMKEIADIGMKYVFYTTSEYPFWEVIKI